MTSTERLTIYPSPGLRDRIRQAALRERRSENAQVLLWVERALDETVPAEEPQTVTSQGGISEEVRAGSGTPAHVGGGRPSRTASCIHGRKASEYCKRCDG